jgi:transglutaminase-like putative cysteine protease
MTAAKYTHNAAPETVERVGIAAMILFATIMLGIGEKSVLLTLVTLVAIAVSAYVTDTIKVFQLSQSVANWVALGIVTVSAANMLYFERAEQIGAVASLQSYLQYVLLFQPKSSRIYWQLVLLSLGQVAIAATLVPGPLFGALLTVYLLLGIVTLTTLVLSADASRYKHPSRDVAGSPNVGGTLAIGGPPMLEGGVAGMPRLLGWGMLEQVGGIFAMTLLAGSLLFFFIPRWQIENREVATDEPLRAVGFSRTITLGELGEVVQNPDVVMRIQFFRGLGTRPFQLADEPLLRGSVVTRYENGAWTQAQSSSIVPLSTDTAPPYVRQRITIEPLDVGELFCVVPVFSLQPDPRLRVNISGEQLARHEDARSRQFEFEVGTNGIVNNRQRKYLPCKWTLRRSGRAQLLHMPEGREGAPDPLAGLRTVADEVLQEKNIDPGNTVAAAHALCDFLRSSGEFTYSLLAQPRDPALDPLEDFVTLHRSGHCEYFAGALVMMLRSQGIPARVAIGFKGGEWNTLGMYYQIQQLHAHTWVEVYLDEEDIPGDAFSDDDGSPPAAWLVLDPTVGVPDANTNNAGVGILARIRQYLDYGQVLWANYVVGLNSRRQQQGIYEPVAAGTRAAFENLFGREEWGRRMRALGNSPVGSFWAWYRRHWFSWWGGLVSVGASLVAAALYFAVRWLVGSLRRIGLVRSRRCAYEPPTLEMYRRLEDALARRGLQRHPAQTAYEFAVVAGGHLAESAEMRSIAHLPRRIIDSFYRVRFGGRKLDNREVQAVELALAELEGKLARSR